jgi:hypothetical protein
MKKRFRLIRRSLQGGKFYIVDTTTGKRESLGTTSEEDAEQILQAKNEAERQPMVNRQVSGEALQAVLLKKVTTRQKSAHMKELP